MFSIMEYKGHYIHETDGTLVAVQLVYPDRSTIVLATSLHAAKCRITQHIKELEVLDYIGSYQYLTKEQKRIADRLMKI